MAEDAPAGVLGEARRLVSAGRFDAALRILSAAPDAPGRETLLGAAELGRRRAASAAGHLRRALVEDPADLDALFHLARAHLQCSAPYRGVALLERLSAVRPDFPGLRRALVAAYRRDARFADALALAGDEDDPELLYERAMSEVGLGDAPAALRSFDRLLALDPEHAAAWFGSHAPALEVAGIDDALRRLRRAVACRGANRKYWGHLCAYHMLLGDRDAARDLFDAHLARHPQRRHLAEATEALLPHLAWDWRLFGMSRDLLRHAVSLATVRGLVLEFGVRRGASIDAIAEAAEQPVHGFDSFVGLPEDWGNEAGGTFTTGGVLPTVRPEVTLHPGWFEETLPPFLAAHQGPVRLANLDCDIYSSTQTVLTALADRIVPGTILVFDEFIGNKTWREHEYKAFAEFVSANGVAFECVAVAPATKQVAIRVNNLRS